MKYLTSVVSNDHEDLNQIAEKAAVKLYGEGCLKHLEKMMGSEDFLLLHGTKFPEFTASLAATTGEGLHGFQPTTTATRRMRGLLKRGAAMYAQFAWDYLEEKAE